MPRQLTSSELYRIYACLKNCEICKAKRGEYCSNRHGKKGRFIHSMRCGRHDTKRGAPLHKAYMKLKTQILGVVEIPGHE